jgi:hypothetical protein
VGIMCASLLHGTEVKLKELLLKHYKLSQKFRQKCSLLKNSVLTKSWVAKRQNYIKYFGLVSQFFLQKILFLLMKNDEVCFHQVVS